MSFITWAKQAGEQDALSAFGLLHQTTRPPPTWSHGQKTTIPSMTQIPLRKVEAHGS